MSREVAGPHWRGDVGQRSGRRGDDRERMSAASSWTGLLAGRERQAG